MTIGRASTSFEASATAGASLRRGAPVIVFVGMVAVLLLSASQPAAASFSVPAIIGFRLLALAAFAALLATRSCR